MLYGKKKTIAFRIAGSIDLSALLLSLNFIAEGLTDLLLPHSVRSPLVTQLDFHEGPELAVETTSCGRVDLPSSSN